MTHSKSENLGVRKRTSRRAMTVGHTRSGVNEDYLVENKVGEGGEGIVYQATRKSTGVMRAIKKVPKKCKGQSKEIDIMRTMDHPNVIKLFETFEDKSAVYLVLELCMGGDLFDKVLEQGSFSEVEAAIVMQEILRAVNYLHSNDIVHRDLKPENFLFLSKAPIDDGENLLKLTDFGIACECKPNEVLRELQGTPFYMAPQVVSGRYDRKCDLWSCGVIMFALLSGGMPFKGPSDREVLRKVKQGVVQYDQDKWSRVSEDGMHLLKRLLTRSPRDRITSEEGLNHDWIKLHAPRAVAQLHDGLVSSLQAFRRQNKLKQVALTVVANEMDDEHIIGLRETFTALDTDGDGLLSLDDIKKGMDQAGIELPADFAELIECEDRGTVLDYTEFLAATITKRHEISEEACRLAFGMFDVDRDGRITAKEITRAFNSSKDGVGKIKLQESQAIIDRYGDAEDGSLNFDGFRKMMSADLSPMTPARDVPSSAAAKPDDQVFDVQSSELPSTASFGTLSSNATPEVCVGSMPNVHMHVVDV